MPIVVMKFGGSCLSDKTAFRQILDIINIYKDVRKIFVVSAFKGITDLLFNTALGLEDNIKTDKNVSLIEKKHLDLIEQIFEEDSEYYIKAKD
ncbi:MAG: hypothetical protein ACFFE4_21295, partial [Candidatus Thorarchaeota archaeon]